METSGLGSTLKHQSELSEKERDLMYPSTVFRENLHVNDLRTSGFFTFIHLKEEVTSCWHHHWTMLQYQSYTAKFLFHHLNFGLFVKTQRININGFQSCNALKLKFKII